MNFNISSLSNKIRKWSRTLHRDLGFFFSGMVIIYGVSGLFMNHIDTINPNYSVNRINLTLDNSFPSKSDITKQDVLNLLRTIHEENKYTKHYFPEENTMKVFIKGGSILTVDLSTKQAVYEKLTRRPILSGITKLHYNRSASHRNASHHMSRGRHRHSGQGQWWTYFSDFFAISLLVITITGLIMVKGSKGFIGRGGIEFAIGIIIPLLFLIL